MEAVPEDKDAQEVELEREAGNRRRGRDILVAVNHGPNSKHAFDWAIAHLCRLADTLHLISVIHRDPKTSEEENVVYEATQGLLENLAREAYEVAVVRTETNIIYGDPGKLICAEAARLSPVAVVMGSRGLGIVKSVLLGSVSEYCSHHCRCPLVIVPPKEMAQMQEEYIIELNLGDFYGWWMSSFDNSPVFVLRDDVLELILDLFCNLYYSQRFHSNDDEASSVIDDVKFAN